MDVSGQLPICPLRDLPFIDHTFFYHTVSLPFFHHTPIPLSVPSLCHSSSTQSPCYCSITFHYCSTFFIATSLLFLHHTITRHSFTTPSVYHSSYILLRCYYLPHHHQQYLCHTITCHASSTQSLCHTITLAFFRHLYLVNHRSPFTLHSPTTLSLCLSFRVIDY